MTARDVAWSIEHFSADTAQTSALGQQVGGVSVTGPLEVTVKLKAPVPTARAGIAITTLVEEAKFAKAHAKTLGNAGTAPIGTGPYKVASQTAEKITLVRNAQYTRTKPAANKVVFSVIPDDTARQLALRSGTIHGGPITDRKSAAQWKAIPGATVYASPSLSQDFLALDVTQAPFDDVHVRRAVAHSVDRAGIMKAGFGAYAKPSAARCEPATPERCGSGPLPLSVCHAFGSQGASAVSTSPATVSLSSRSPSRERRKNKGPMMREMSCLACAWTPGRSSPCRAAAVSASVKCWSVRPTMSSRMCRAFSWRSARSTTVAMTDAETGWLIQSVCRCSWATSWSRTGLRSKVSRGRALSASVSMRRVCWSGQCR